jgi:hydroxyacylglutathione hydrolase
MKRIEQFSGHNFVIHKVETSPYGTNAYVLICKKTSESLIVDAPGETDRILQVLGKSHPKMIVLTHNHFDHTGALAGLVARLKIPVTAHIEDSRLPLGISKTLEHGEVITIGEVQLKVLHTPGHTPGSICLLTENMLLSGDSLFPHGPGRTNSPKDFQTILQSLEKEIFILPDCVLVLPGHGAATILEKEKEEFAAFRSRSHPPGLCGNVLWLS